MFNFLQRQHPFFEHPVLARRPLAVDVFFEAGWSPRRPLVVDDFFEPLLARRPLVDDFLVLFFDLL